jgi:hypothetical protein
MKLEFSRQIFEKQSYIQSNENTSSGSRVVSCAQTNRQTDMMKLIVAFRNFANAPKYVTPARPACEQHQAAGKKKKKLNILLPTALNYGKVTVP